MPNVPPGMMQVRKYPVPLDGPFEMELPKGADIVNFDLQMVQQPAITTPGQGASFGLFVWALVDPEQPPERRKLWVTATGRPLPKPKRHLGSVQGGPYVFHLFEMPDKPRPSALGIGEFELLEGGRG